MTDSIKKMCDFYAQKPGAPLYFEEFGFFTVNRWVREGHIKNQAHLNDIFGYDSGGKHLIRDLGWCEAAFSPFFKEEILETRGEHELIRDAAGRHKLCFRGRRHGFMPEYVDHPVKDIATWERDVKWRLDPATTARYEGMAGRMAPFAEASAEGAIIAQALIGGFMFLRSLVGPEDILYMVYDEPELIHTMMRTWFELSDAVIAAHQEHVVLDELYIAEDICYNHGPLISPDMMREFLFPYYRQLITNTKKRQKDGRHLYFQVDTDGDCRPAIPVYQELGMDHMSPFEVASGCDVVEIRKQYPHLLMRGGIDKRIITAGRSEIERELERVIPFMRQQGGYIPTCDHGVPEEVSFENYCFFREKLRELGE